MSVPDGDVVALLKQRIQGYQASRDYAIGLIAKALGIEADNLRAVEYYAAQAVAEIERQALALAEARRLNEQLVEALDDVFALIDEGYLARDISNDAQPGFALRQLPYVTRLAKAGAALKAARGEKP